MTTVINVRLPDGSSRELPEGSTGEDLAASIGRGLAKAAVAVTVDGFETDLWPGAKYAIGPPIEDGFYYDFELPGGVHFSDDDLGRIEARMREIVAADQPFVREEHSVAEGLKLFADQPYKQEIIEG